VSHLLGLEDLTPDQIQHYLASAQQFKRDLLMKPVKKSSHLKGKAVVNLFFEPSTRTRASFELAAKYLGADVMSLTGLGSSVEKGETLTDTVQNLAQMAIDALVVRHATAGVPWQLSQVVSIPVINAGDGWHEHPTQGLLDLLTMFEHFGTLSGLRVAIVGDIEHSRVARSDLWGFLKMGSRVTLIGPPQLVARDWEAVGADVRWDLASGLKDADVVISLRIQAERQALAGMPSVNEYRERWGLTEMAIKWLKPNAIILHPGPQNRGVEIDSAVIRATASRIHDQVTNGVAVRMAVLSELLGGVCRDDERVDSGSENIGPVSRGGPRG
jgi:aspartate carbamoyltransferase catalytic subunit